MEKPENQVRVNNKRTVEDKGILSSHYHKEIQALGRNFMELPENACPVSS